MTSVVFYDIETKTVADDHPGKWNDIPKFGMSLAVTWDNLTNYFRTFDDAGKLYNALIEFDRIVSFNGLRFDNPIVANDAGLPVAALDEKTFDVLDDLKGRLRHRVKLDQLAEGTLGKGKIAMGTDAVLWWKAIQELHKVWVDDPSSALSRALKLGIDSLLWRLEFYCKMDVAILRDVYKHGCRHGAVVYMSYGSPNTVPVDWPRDWLRNESGN